MQVSENTCKKKFKFNLYWPPRDLFRCEHSETFVGMLAPCHIAGETKNVFLNCRGSSSSWDRMYFCPSFLFTQGPGDYFYRLRDVLLMQWPTPKNRKPQFLWKSTRWKQIAPRENNILAGAHSGGQLDPNACMIYHFLYLLLYVWSCCVEHNDPWLKIELRLWDSSGAILIRCLVLLTQQDYLKPEINGCMDCHTDILRDSVRI